MKVFKKTSVSGEWCKAGIDIKEGDLITILNGGETVAGEFGDRSVFKVKVSSGEKNLSFNQTSINNLISAYGDDTQNWVGKEVKVFIVKQMIDGKLRNVAYLTGKDWTMLEDGTFIKESQPGEYPENNLDESPF